MLLSVDGITDADKWKYIWFLAETDADGILDLRGEKMREFLDKLKMGERAVDEALRRIMEKSPLIEKIGLRRYRVYSCEEAFGE